LRRSGRQVRHGVDLAGLRLVLALGQHLLADRSLSCGPTSAFHQVPGLTGVVRHRFTDRVTRRLAFSPAIRNRILMATLPPHLGVSQRSDALRPAHIHSPIADLAGSIQVNEVTFTT